MKANDIFNFRRFGRYFASDLRTCTANYGLSLLTISILTPVATYALFVTFNALGGNMWNGPGMGSRVFVFFVAMVCMVATMPVKCYGRLTEKQYGSFWLTLPASRLEKFLSMIIICCIAVPIVGAALYIGTDSIICALDKTCGRNLAVGAFELLKGLDSLGNELGNMTLNLGTDKIPVTDPTLSADIFRQMSSPWLYADELFGITLPFLLGAVFFKSGKTVKTIIALAAFSTLVSMSLTPFLNNYISSVFSAATGEEDAIANIINSGIFRNLATIDTISDTIMNTAMLIGIWFRIKTLKH